MTHPLRALRKNVVRPIVRGIGQRLLNVVGVPIRFGNVEMAARMAVVLQLRSRYPNLEAPDSSRQEIHRHELKVYSQHGEDGVLAYLFSKIGLTNGRFIEFGIEDGTQCNTACLSLHFGWQGLLLEGDPNLARRAGSFYAKRLGSDATNVRVENAFITAENVNEIFQQNGYSGEIDLLSIDIDGNDYWVWKAVETVSPRVVCIEYNSVFGPTRSVTIPYDPAFERRKKHEGGLYYGASLAALTKLAKQRGYILVGCESHGVNAFFVRRDAAGDHLREVDVATAFVPQLKRIENRRLEDLYEEIAPFGLEEV